MCLYPNQVSLLVVTAGFAIPHHEVCIVCHHPTGNASSCCLGFFLHLFFFAPCYSLKKKKEKWNWNLNMILRVSAQGILCRQGKKINFMSVNLKCCTCSWCNQQNKEQRAGIQLGKQEKKCSHPSHRSTCHFSTDCAAVGLAECCLDRVGGLFNCCMISFIIMLAALSAVRFFQFLSVHSAFCCPFSFCYTCFTFSFIFQCGRLMISSQPPLLLVFANRKKSMLTCSTKMVNECRSV